MPPCAPGLPCGSGAARLRFTHTWPWLGAALLPAQSLPRASPALVRLQPCQAHPEAGGSWLRHHILHTEWLQGQPFFNKNLNFRQWWKNKNSRAQCWLEKRPQTASFSACHNAPRTAQAVISSHTRQAWEGSPCSGAARCHPASPRAMPMAVALHLLSLAARRGASQLARSLREQARAASPKGSAPYPAEQRNICSLSHIHKETVVR